MSDFNTNNHVVRLATLLTAASIALAMAVATPTPAEANTGTWTTKVPPTTPQFTVCGETPRTVPGTYVPGRPRPYALIKECLITYRNRFGTYYFQGALNVDYRTSAETGITSVFSGRSMPAVGGSPKASAITDCPRRTFVHGDNLWCYSTTVSTSAQNVVLYAKGILFDTQGLGYAVWSPTVTTN